MKPEKVTSLSFLTEQEKDALHLFILNDTMREAVRKVLLDGATNMGVQRAGEPSLIDRNWVFGLDRTGTMSDDAFGRAIRVHTEAIVLIEQSFDAMNKIVPPAPEPVEKPKHL